MIKKVVVFPFLIMIGFSLIIAIPISFLSDNLSSYDFYDDSFSYEYYPDSPSTVECLNLNIELGNVEIKYVNPPVNYHAKIAVYIEMAGPGLAGKDCFDYFIINEGNLTDSSIDFSLELQPGITGYEINSLIKNVTILVSLSKAIIFNISTFVINGNIKLSVPFNVQVNNLNAHITSGDILFDLRNCIIEGNITGIGNQSTIELRTYNIQCTKDSNWYLKNAVGDLILNITQSVEMGANITVDAEIGTQYTTAYVFYKDFSPNIGSILYINQWEGYFPDECEWVGYKNWKVLDTTPIKGYLFTSLDFPAQYNYNISLNNITLNNNSQYQPYFWNLYNE